MAGLRAPPVAERVRVRAGGRGVGGAWRTCTGWRRVRTKLVAQAQVYAVQLQAAQEQRDQAWQRTPAQEVETASATLQTSSRPYFGTHFIQRAEQIILVPVIILRKRLPPRHRLNRRLPRLRPQASRRPELARLGRPRRRHRWRPAARHSHSHPRPARQVVCNRVPIRWRRRRPQAARTVPPRRRRRRRHPHRRVGPYYPPPRRHPHRGRRPSTPSPRRQPRRRDRRRPRRNCCTVCARRQPARLAPDGRRGGLEGDGLLPLEDGRARGALGGGELLEAEDVVGADGDVFGLGTGGLGVGEGGGGGGGGLGR